MTHYEYVKQKLPYVLSQITLMFHEKGNLTRYIAAELELAFLAGEANALQKELERIRNPKT